MISLHEGCNRVSLDGTWKHRLETDTPVESLGYPDPGTAASWPERWMTGSGGAGPSSNSTEIVVVAPEG